MKDTKKFLRGALAILLCVSALLSVTSCTSGGKDNSSSNGTENQQQSTGYKIVNRSVSEYKIVVPNDATSNVSFASSELNYFLREATGAEISVIKESEYKGKEPVMRSVPQEEAIDALLKVIEENS